AGFIGSYLVDHYQRIADVTVLDNFHTGSAENLNHCQCRIIEGSVEDERLTREACKKIDVVFHLAGITSIAESVRKPEVCFRINSGGTLNLLRGAVQMRVRRFVFASSAAIYGIRNKISSRDRTNGMLPTPYALSKLQSDYQCDKFRRRFGLLTLSLRYFNVYGPRQNPKNVISVFLQRARHNLPLHIHGDGRQTRDLVHVEDVVRATVLAMEKS